MDGCDPHDKDREYLLAFTSFYRSMYAKDRLRARGMNAVPMRVPAGVFGTCSQGLYITKSDIEEVVAVLHENDVGPKKIYKVIYVNGRREYREIT